MNRRTRKKVLKIALWALVVVALCCGVSTCGVWLFTPAPVPAVFATVEVTANPTEGAVAVPTLPGDAYFWEGPITLPTEVSTLTPEPTNTPRPTLTPVPTPMPTASPTGLTFGEIEQNYERMTDLQWAEYAPGLSGIRVRWTARVREVGENGTVYLTIGGASFGSTCDLKDVPHEVAMGLQQNQAIVFEATIVTVKESWFLFDYLEVLVGDTVILQ